MGPGHRPHTFECFMGNEEGGFTTGIVIIYSGDTLSSMVGQAYVCTYDDEGYPQKLSHYHSLGGGGTFGQRRLGSERNTKTNSHRAPLATLLMMVVYGEGDHKCMDEGGWWL